MQAPRFVSRLLVLAASDPRHTLVSEKQLDALQVLITAATHGSTHEPRGS